MSSRSGWNRLKTKKVNNWREYYGSRKVVVSNPTGLHLRPAGLFCKTAVEFRCSVKFRTNKGESNAKSVLSVLGACVKCGDELEIICDGEDEKQALETMVALVESGLGE